MLVTIKFKIISQIGMYYAVNAPRLTVMRYDVMIRQRKTSGGSKLTTQRCDFSSVLVEYTAGNNALIVAGVRRKNAKSQIRYSAFVAFDPCSKQREFCQRFRKVSVEFVAVYHGRASSMIGRHGDGCGDIAGAGVTRGDAGANEGDGR